ncbi:MAG TPA: hypothetical protein PLP35_09070 [Caldisericia bacterium]|nr:hypothetical protein [Caldisericia bacterium]HPF49830.1 hypothetical protein [Caldisericia bacterium]
MASKRLGGDFEKKKNEKPEDIPKKVSADRLDGVKEELSVLASPPKSRRTLYLMDRTWESLENARDKLIEYENNYAKTHNLKIPRSDRIKDSDFIEWAVHESSQLVNQDIKNAFQSIRKIQGVRRNKNM